MASGDEQDVTKPTDNWVGGSRIIKLGNVSTPELQMFLPPKETANGAAVLVCPGGGFSILAWDLEGTEVAQWLNSLGLAAAVLKYRVPTGGHEGAEVWQGPAMDAQRGLNLIRDHADQWNIDPGRVGILGFSACDALAGSRGELVGRPDPHQVGRKFEVMVQLESFGRH